jgi:pimeloyl-ACP methyl ester carboxylesterase
MRLSPLLLPLLLLPVHALTRRTIANIGGFSRHVFRCPASDVEVVVPDTQTWDESRATLLFIPGLEFSGLSLEQYAADKRVANEYNLAFACCGDDRLVDFGKIDAAVREFVGRQPRAVLVGESFGALPALSAGRQLPRIVEGIVLLNSATAYASSDMPRAIDAVRAMDDLGYTATLLQVLALNSQGTRVTPQNMAILVQMLVNMLLFRKWIVEGNAVVADAIGDGASYSPHVVAVASAVDALFPSVLEAERLRELLSSCDVVTVPHSNHFVSAEHFSLPDALRTIHARGA